MNLDDRIERLVEMVEVLASQVRSMAQVPSKPRPNTTLAVIVAILATLLAVNLYWLWLTQQALEKHLQDVVTSQKR